MRKDEVLERAQLHDGDAFCAGMFRVSYPPQPVDMRAIFDCVRTFTCNRKDLYIGKGKRRKFGENSDNAVKNVKVRPSKKPAFLEVTLTKLDRNRGFYVFWKNVKVATPVCFADWLAFCSESQVFTVKFW